MHSGCGIYRIFHKETGKSYIGQSINIENRVWRHFHYLKKGTHSNCHLQRAFTLYGFDNFSWQILETCEESMLTDREIYWIDTLDFCFGVYNLAKPENGQMVSEETRAKISNALKGKPQSFEHRQNMRKSQLGKTRPAFSKEHRRKLSEATKLYHSKRSG